MAQSTGRRVFPALFCITVLFFIMECNSFTSGFQFSKFTFIIPHEATRGHVITKLFCYNEDEQSTSDLSPSDLVMSNLFELGSCGELIVSQTPVYMANEPFHIISISSKCSGLKSVSVSKNITVYVKNGTETLAFPKTVYRAYLHPNSYEPLLLGIESLFAQRADGNSQGILYRLIGKGSENFELVPFQIEGRVELFVKSRGSVMKKKYHLTVSAETIDGRKGHTNLWIYTNRSMLQLDEIKHKAHIENISETKAVTKVQDSPLQFSPEASLSSNKRLLSRKRRQVPNQLQRNLNETARGLLFNVALTTLDPTLQYVLYNSSLKNTFSVSSDGIVSLVSGAKLDYDNPDIRSPFLFIALTRKNDSTDTKIGRIIAEDYDNRTNGTFSLSLVSQSDPGTLRLEGGDIYTNVTPEYLDRETKDFYTITVKATDDGIPTRMSFTAVVNITLTDINDHDPYFNTTYNVTMSEHVQVQSEIVRIRAFDQDIGINAEITYSMPDEFRTHFKMDTDVRTNEGVLTVFKQVDFNGKEYTASTTIFITINDEKPVVINCGSKVICRYVHLQVMTIIFTSFMAIHQKLQN